MSQTTQERNKALVLDAFDTLFNMRDYEAAARFWSDTYIQHSDHIEPGREGLFDLIRSAPDTLRYESGIVVAEGDYVILHGRFTGEGRPAARIAADVVRIEDGRLAATWGRRCHRMDLQSLGLSRSPERFLPGQSRRALGGAVGSHLLLSDFCCAATAGHRPAAVARASSPAQWS